MRYEFAFVNRRGDRAYRYPKLQSNSLDRFNPTVQYIRAKYVVNRDPIEGVADYIADAAEVVWIRFYGLKQYTFDIRSSKFPGAKKFIRYDLVGDGNWDAQPVSHAVKNRHVEDSVDNIYTFAEDDPAREGPYAIGSYNILTGVADRVADDGEVWVHSRGDGAVTERGSSSAQSLLTAFKNWPTWELREAYLEAVNED